MHVVDYAMRTFYDNRAAWDKLVQSAMSRDFSWGVSADKYLALYEEITGIPAKKPAETPAAAPKSVPRRKKSENFAKKIARDTAAAESTWAAETASKDGKVLSEQTDAQRAEKLERTKAEIEKSAPKPAKTAKKPAKKSQKKPKKNK